MWNLFKTDKTSEKNLKKLVDKINAENDLLIDLSNDELRNRTKQLADQVATEMEGHTNAIRHLQQQSNSKALDVIQRSRLYTEIEQKKKEFYEKSEQVLEKYIAPAFAILKTTCYRFSTSDMVHVTANEFDKQMALEQDYITIEEATALYQTRWMAGGKEIRWNMVPYNSQLMAGIVLQYGEIAEMLNGEGKTLAALFPVFLHCIAGRKVFVCTANPFLSARDCEWMRPILSFHGFEVAEIDGTASGSEERVNAYKADVVYGTANEFGFDYLRDNIGYQIEETLQTELDFILIDEIDSILIDDARTPVIISGPVEKKDSILYEFELLNTAIAHIVYRQLNMLEEFLEEARELIKNQDYENACILLYYIRRGNPDNSDLYYLINTTPNLLSQLNKLEKKITATGLDVKTEEDLYYIVKGSSIEVNEKGKALLGELLEEPDFWILPDIDREMTLIKEKELPVPEETEEKRQLIERFEFVERRHDIVTKLLKAYVLFHKDNDYIIAGDEIKIIDDNTGRALEGRRYSDGLHQAIEAKEGVPIQGLSESYATISLQSYFQKYRKLAGMTGTAKIDEKEYHLIYEKKVISIPPFKPTIRKDYRDLVFKTKREKLLAIIQEAERLVAANRPVLIGTTTVEDSELISELLHRSNIPHHVLNARQDVQEALIIAEAGIPGTITVAAMMAGRGTDIKLTPESIAAGGLAVLGFERHETRRLDYQLKGRAGRQGDPGSSQFFVSLEDNLMRMFGSERIASMMDTMGYQEGEVIQHSMIDGAIQRAQRKVEESNLATRNRLYEYDNSLNLARESIYQKRNHALSGYRITLDIMIMFQDVSQHIIRSAGKEYDKFTVQVFDILNYKTKISSTEFNQLPPEDLYYKLAIEAYENYMLSAEKLAAECFPVFTNIHETQGSHIENVIIPFFINRGKASFNITVGMKKTLSSKGFEAVERFQAMVVLLTIDKHWRAFLRRYDKIKEDLSLLSTINKADPLVLFKKDIAEYYMELLIEIHYEIVYNLCFIKISVNLDQTTDTEEETEEGIEEDTGIEAYEDTEEPTTDQSAITDEYIRANSGHCYQVTGKDSTGQVAWYFVLVDPDKKEAFLEHIQGDSYDIADYGRIIASGYGETIPESVQQHLRDKYGFDNF
jgi:preprotein translocase subunit SecA